MTQLGRHPNLEEGDEEYEDIDPYIVPCLCRSIYGAWAGVGMSRDCDD